MPRTPDRRPGEQIEDDRILFEDRGSDATEVGAVYRKGSSLYGRDGTGIFNLRSTAGSVDNGFIIFTTVGGMVYDTGGNILQKESDT